jgi:ABC-type cobalamin transport system permease subunit
LDLTKIVTILLSKCACASIDTQLSLWARSALVVDTNVLITWAIWSHNNLSNITSVELSVENLVSCALYASVAISLITLYLTKIVTILLSKCACASIDTQLSLWAGSALVVGTNVLITWAIWSNYSLLNITSVELSVENLSSCA